MRTVELAFPQAPIEAALCDRFVDRLRGLLLRPPGTVLVIPGSSVHGVAMRRPVRAIGLGSDGRVVGHRILHPWRCIRIRGARWIVEAPLVMAVPEAGIRLLS